MQGLYKHMNTGSQSVTKALFLDRDGVINKDKGYVHKIEDCEFIDGIFEICRLAQKNSYLTIVVTNQAGIARGFYSEKDFQILMEHIRAEFIRQDCPLTDVFYCPYLEDGLPPWNVKSPDRKPAPGMILKAAHKYGLDLQKCIMLGDRESDMQAGQNAGIIHNFRMDWPEDRQRLLKLLQDADLNNYSKNTS